MARPTLYDMMTRQVGKKPFERIILSKQPFPKQDGQPKHDQSTRGMIPPKSKSQADERQGGL